MAKMEQNQAETVFENVQRNEDLRQQVLGNLTRGGCEHNATLEQIRSVHQGVYNWNIVSNVYSDTVGGITGLQQKADAEALRIQAEWEQVAVLDQREKLQEMVANMLQGKAKQYSKTSSNLLYIADLWDQHAQIEYESAQKVNKTASELEADVAELNKRQKKPVSMKPRRIWMLTSDCIPLNLIISARIGVPFCPFLVRLRPLSFLCAWQHQGRSPFWKIVSMPTPPLEATLKRKLAQCQLLRLACIVLYGCA
jgi:hypothetical protein